MKLSKINMLVIPQSEQRYDTVGDYWIDADGTWQFRVSDLGDWRYNFSVLLHEFIEFALITQHGVPEKAVLDFDLSVPTDSQYSDDPGFDPTAPYHTEHVYADCMERLIAPYLGISNSAVNDAISLLPDWVAPS